MSSGSTQVAVLGMRGQLLPERPASLAGERPHAIRLIAFAALGLYGITRWSKLLSGGTHGRLVAILALALLLAGARPTVAKASRALAAVFTVVVLLAAFPVAGLPLHWLLHLRIAVIANAIGGGISTLPQTLVPYTGADQWVRLVIILGATVLLFDAALLLAFAPRAMDDLRRAGAALPLVALVAVPSALVHPRFPYLNGLLLFLMLAAFILGDRIEGRQAASAIGLCLITAITAMLVAPGLDSHSFWLNPETLAGSPAPKPVEVFNWMQTYGPVTWPHGGHTVLEIKARRPDYWKAEDLDVFDIHGWMEGVVPGQENTPAPSSSALAAWSQTIRVTIRDMRTNDVIAAGLSDQPTHVSQPVVGGYSLGTWTTGSQLKSGDSYSVRVYTPQPTAEQLNADRGSYAGLPAGYRTIIIPAPAQPGGAPSAQVVFPSFHSAAPVENVIGVPVSEGPSVIRDSAYAPAYGLAQRLARGAATPYAFARAVERFLRDGYVYTQNPPVRPYPLESFLFRDKRGYCQQFAGAMALLLRMGGVPARVAVGFTQGRQDPATNDWLVTDLNAHAWVEVWFPRYGWVKFDPTPPVDPALKHLAPVPSATAGLSSGGAAQNNRNGAAKIPLRTHAGGARSGHSQGAGTWEGLAAASLLLMATLVLLWLGTRPLRSTDDLVSELERALARSGRPLAAKDTLAGLEQSFRRSPAAGQYVRALRLGRFGGGEAHPTPAQRRALRRQLALRAGPLGKLRALWALPPRRRAPATRAAGHPGA
jgi:transglutaminase-like putative cysteine protease